MAIALIFNKTRPDALGVYFERACRALGVAYDHWALFNVGQIPATYDLYLRIDHGDDYLTTIPARLRPAVFYVADTHLPHSWRKIRQAAGQYDLVCCAQRDAAARLPRAAWLPFACDPDLPGACGAPRAEPVAPKMTPRAGRHPAHPLDGAHPRGPRPEAVAPWRGGTAPTWDVAFVGMDGGIPRKFYLQALRERYPNSSIGMADHTELGRIYSSARIGFNYSIADEVNMRMFEVLSAGTLLVTNRLSHDAFGALGFQEGVHFVAYQGPRDVFDVIDTCLSQAARRERIARQGMAFVRERHTYIHRLRQLLQLAREQLGVTITAAHHTEAVCVSSVEPSVAP